VLPVPTVRHFRRKRINGKNFGGTTEKGKPARKTEENIELLGITDNAATCTIHIVPGFI
jgi:hypothetical protein